MGAECAAGYRGYLDNLVEANNRNKALAFSYIKTGNAAGILYILQRNPGLLQQASDEGHGANLIIAALYEIKNTQNQRIRRNLIGLLNTIINDHRNRLDLTFQDSDGNTALHRVFWYAIYAVDEETSKAFTEIGVKFLGLITGAAHFRQIIALKNIHGETFLKNIFLSDARLNEVQKQNRTYVQEQVGPLLNPFKAAPQTAVPIQIDFTQQSFIDRLEELLLDPVLYVLLENPVLLTTEGHTMSSASWAGLLQKRNPLTGLAYQDNQLQPNQTAEKIVALFKKNKEEAKPELELVEQITELFNNQGAPTAIEDLFLSPPDILIQSIKELVSSYNQQFKPGVESIATTAPAINATTNAATNAANVPPDDPSLPETNTETAADDKGAVLEILGELKNNIKHKTGGRVTWLHMNTGNKVAKLDTISAWVQAQEELTALQTEIVLSLIRDVCALKRNGLFGLFTPNAKPHSLTEFQHMTSQKGLHASEIVSFSASELNRLSKKDLGIEFFTERMAFLTPTLT